MGSCVSLNDNSNQKNVNYSNRKIVKKANLNRGEKRFYKEELLHDKDFMNRRNIQERLDEFLDALLIRHVDKGEFVFKYGDKSDILYLIGSGNIEVITDEGVDCGTLMRGQLLGTYGFFQNKTRSANAKCIKKGKLYYIDLKTYNAILFSRVARPSDLGKYNIFYSLTDDERVKVFTKLKSQFVNTDEVVVNEDDPFNCIYLVTNGSISGTNKNKVHHVGTNNHFGNLELKDDSKKWLGAYVATEPSTVIKIPLDVLINLMPQQLYSLKNGSGTISTNDVNVKLTRKKSLERRKSLTSTNLLNPIV